MPTRHWLIIFTLTVAGGMAAAEAAATVTSRPAAACEALVRAPLNLAPIHSFHNAGGGLLIYHGRADAPLLNNVDRYAAGTPRDGWLARDAGLRPACDGAGHRASRGSERLFAIDYIAAMADRGERDRSPDRLRVARRTADGGLSSGPTFIHSFSAAPATEISDRRRRP